MVSAPQFDSLEQMVASDWLADIKNTFAKDEFPAECSRCQQTETISNTSIRLNSLAFDTQQSKLDYLVVGGVLDNVCNSGCQTCNATLSTKIGSLKNQNYIKVDNSADFWRLPLDRIVHLDINGGEPSASKNYKHLLSNLPASVRSIRLNTNCSKVMTELVDLVARGIKITVTVSLDGVGHIHNYVRWPIDFKDFERNLMCYQQMNIELNTWTTVSALNIGDLKNIFQFVQTHKLQHSWALLHDPDVLNVKYSNHLTRTADVPDQLKDIVASDKDNTVELQMFTAHQDHLRGIKLWDYYKWKLQ